MTAAIGLGAAVVATALWSGLLLMVTTVLHPVYASRDAAGFAAGDVILRWDPDAVPDDWRVVRRRYLLLNWARAVATWTALVLFVIATVVHLQG